MKEFIPDKYLVIPTKYLSLLNDEYKLALSMILEQIREHRSLQGKDPNPIYYVCKRSDSNAPEILDLILENPPVKSLTKQIGGDHYKRFKIQPWDVIDEYGLNFYAGNVLKYLLRYQYKDNPLLDIEKLIHYAEKLFENLKSK